jgi:hypothetical protein
MEEQKKTKPQVHIKNKHTDDLVDHYWGSINYVANLIKASELKAGLILTFYGILLNFIYNNIQSVIEATTGMIGFYILLGLCFICVVVSIFYSIRCFMPRIETKYDKSIFFFGDVTSSFGDIREFSKIFYEVSIDEDRLFAQLGQQIFINSKIAEIKFKNIKRSMQFLALALFLIIILTAFYVLNSAF